MFSKIRISLTILFLIAVMSPMMAQDTSFIAEGLADRLGLTEEQIAALEQLQEDFQAALQPLQDDRAASREALAAELDAEEPSAALVGELFLAIQDLSAQMEALRQDYIAGFEAILTEEQLELLQRLRDRRRHRHLHDRLAESEDAPQRFAGFFPVRVLSRVLDLSEEQVDQLQTLLDDLQSVVQPLCAERRLLHDQLNALLESEAPDAEEVGSAVIGIHEINLQIDQAKQDFASSFEAILTPEQFEKLQQFLENPLRGPRGRPARGSR